MNLVEESFQTKKEDKSKKMIKIILIFIVLIIFLIIGIVGYMIYIENSTLKIRINGVAKNEVAKMLEFEEDGTIYVPIKRIAPYLGYESYNGEYSDRSESTNKCYIQNENEIANFELNKKKIYKLNISNESDNYEYFYLSKPVKASGGELYVTTDGMQQAFNVTFNYDQDKNRIDIYTMPYLIEFYQPKVLDYGYKEISKEFVNQKTVVATKSMLVVEKDKNIFGVIETSTGKEILEPKYENITYLPYTGDFLVQSNKKVGIISVNKEIKVDLLYDSIELMDIDAGLYLVKKDGQSGVIDTKGNVKIYAENDSIGIDTTKFTKNDIKNKYILAENLIPVCKGGKWGLFDKTGKQLVDFTYDSMGYIASSAKDAINLLVIPDYNVIVVCKNKKYTLINSSGKQPITAFVDDIYMTINANQKYYIMKANNKEYDLLDYLDKLEDRDSSSTSSSSKEKTNTSNTENTNTTKKNTTNTENTNTTNAENKNSTKENSNNNNNANNNNSNNNNSNNNNNNSNNNNNNSNNNNSRNQQSNNE